MFGRKKKEVQKKEKREAAFKREAYIPKSKLQKKERTVPGQRGKAQQFPKGVGRKAIVLALWLCFFGEVVYVLLFAGFFAVTNIETKREGGETLSSAALEGALAASWQGKYLGLIPKNNILFLRPKTEEERLQKRYPKIGEIRITKRLPHTLRVELAEKPYQVLWCSKEACFLIGAEGFAEDAGIFFQYQEEQGQVVRIQDTREEEVAVGVQVLEQEEREFIHALVSDFSLRTGLEIVGPWEQPGSQAQEMRIRTGKGFSVFLNTKIPVAESLNTLMLLLQKEVPENEWDKIQYIDLRTENRIYYTRHDRAPEKTEAQRQREEEEEKKRKEEEEKKQNGQ